MECFFHGKTSTTPAARLSVVGVNAVWQWSHGNGHGSRLLTVSNFMTSLLSSLYRSRNRFRRFFWSASRTSTRSLYKVRLQRTDQIFSPRYVMNDIPHLIVVTMVKFSVIFPHGVGCFTLVYFFRLSCSSSVNY